jgi:hypothetical protein
MRGSMIATVILRDILIEVLLSAFSPAERSNENASGQNTPRAHKL